MSKRSLAGFNDLLHPSELLPRKRRTLHSFPTILNQSALSPASSPQCCHSCTSDTNVAQIDLFETTGLPAPHYFTISVTSAPRGKSAPQACEPEAFKRSAPGLATALSSFSRIPSVELPMHIGLGIQVPQAMANVDMMAPPDDLSPEPEYTSTATQLPCTTDPTPASIRMRCPTRSANGGFDDEYQRLQMEARRMGQKGVLGLIAARNMRRRILMEE